VGAYLKRVNYAARLSPTLECLIGLQEAQDHTIAFENFDIHLGRAIDLSPEYLFHKIVDSRRGGYCFELNGLFLSALKQIGFDARPLLGRVHISGTATGRGHQISLVSIEEKEWIVDVGFGKDTPLAPVPLETNVEFDICGRSMQIVESRKYGFMLQILKEKGWSDLYSFDLEHVCQGDIEYGNYYTSRVITESGV
jgi:N-hydroxyarylamine O-acetyltransferase